MPRKQKVDRKVKKNRETSLQKIIAGKEPIVSNPTKLELSELLNWYADCAEPKQYPGWLTTWAKAAGYKPEDIALLKSRGKKIVPTFAHLARAVTNGCVFEDKHIDTLKAGIADFLAKARFYDAEEGEEEDESLAKIRANIRKYGHFSRLDAVVDQSIEGLLMGDPTIAPDCFERLKSDGITAAEAKTLKDAYAPMLAEFKEARKGKDDQLKEGYAFLKKRGLEKLIKFLEELSSNLELVISSKKAQRKPRKQLAVSSEKIVRRVKFQKDSAEYNLTSILPEKIIGAKLLWVFNTSNRVLSYYKSDTGLKVKGTTIQDYTESSAKKLRKPKEVLPTILSATQSSSIKKFAALKTATRSTKARINDKTILLKVF